MKIAGNTAISGNISFSVNRGNAGNSKKYFFSKVMEGLPFFGNTREVNIWRLKNFVNLWRGLWRVAFARIIGIPHIYGVVSIKVFRASGEVVDYGLASLRVVTDTGVGYIVDAFQNIVEAENMKFHGFGTGAAAEAAGNTALGTELTTQYAVDNTRPTGSTTEGASANIYRSVGTLSPDASCAITEHGIFSASSAGVLLDRSVFSVVNLSSGESLQVTYDLTFSSGG
jgi:hypothetical protein